MDTTLTTPQPVASSAIVFQTEPMLDKFSHLYGTMRLFAPEAPQEQWGELPWRLTSEKGQPNVNGGKPLDYMIKPGKENFDYCWNHTSIITGVNLWPQM